jgi:hypothetical protein
MCVRCPMFIIQNITFDPYVNENATYVQIVFYFWLWILGHEFTVCTYSTIYYIINRYDNYIGDDVWVYGYLPIIGVFKRFGLVYSAMMQFYTFYDIWKLYIAPFQIPLIIIISFWLRGITHDEHI